NTLPGKLVNNPAMVTANTAFTISSRKKMINKNKPTARLPMTDWVMEPMDCPRFRADAHSVPKSCIPAKKMVPNTTHNSAGSQPQMTAIAGPTMGAAPATELKWWPHRTNLLVGTKSTPSLNSWAGVLKFGSSWYTFSAKYLE